MGIIDVNNLSFNYGKKEVLKDFSLTIEQGRIMGLLGPNGVGKSTLINILNGFLKPTAGSAKIYGEDCSRLSYKLKQRMAYLMEGHLQYNFMTAYQAQTFYRHFYPNWDDIQYVNDIAEAGIRPKQLIGTMSCGQRSQVALAIVMAQNPELLILDDFSMGLDPISRRRFIIKLKQYAETNTITVLASSHIIQDMEHFIDDVTILGVNSEFETMTLSSFMGKYKQLGNSLEDVFINLFINKI